MIRVRVELLSANTGEVTELARMHISNDGLATGANYRRGAYLGETFVGRSAAQLNRKTVSRLAVVEGWRRHDFHVWNLVRLMLDRMGYTLGVPAPPLYKVRKALLDAEVWFADYERQHIAKGTLDGDVKARTNAERAEAMRAALALLGGGHDG